MLFETTIKIVKISYETRLNFSFLRAMLNIINDLNESEKKSTVSRFFRKFIMQTAADKKFIFNFREILGYFDENLIDIDLPSPFL